MERDKIAEIKKEVKKYCSAISSFEQSKINFKYALEESRKSNLTKNNDDYDILSEENYNSLMDYCNGVKIEFICALISVANIIDKYNFIPNLNYKYNFEAPNDVPISYVYVLN